MAIISLPVVRHNSEALLHDLLNEVRRCEGNLSGGADIGVGEQAIRRLMATRIWFGNLNGNLMRLTVDSLNEAGVELTNRRKVQMQEKYAFYFLTLTVCMQPQPGVKFARVICELQFPDAVVVEAMFPQGKWKNGLSAGAELNMGIDGDLKLMADLQGGDSKNGGAAATTAKIGGFLRAPRFTYNFGDAEVVAKGEESSTAYWRLESTELQKADDLRFTLVFKTPPNTTRLKVSGTALAEPQFNWLAGNLRDLVPHFSQRIKDLFLPSPGEKQREDRLPVGVGEEWNLELQ